MKFITAIKDRIEKRKKQKSCDQIRQTLSMFGYDTTDMTDKDIENGLIEMSKIMRKTGVTASQAKTRLDILAKYWRQK